MMLFKLSPAEQDWDYTVKIVWFIAYAFSLFMVIAVSYNQFIDYHVGDDLGLLSLFVQAFLSGVFSFPNKNKKDTEEPETDTANDTPEETKPSVLLIIFLVEFLLFGIATIYGNLH